MKYIKLLFLYCCIFSTNLFADTLDSFISSINEQEITASWVADNSSTVLTQQQIKSIVSHTYANSISNDINPKLLLALIKTESSFVSNAKSNHHALGLTQVIVRWHKKKLKNRSLYNPEVAIEVGALILKECINKFNGSIYKGLSCYSGYNKTYAVKVNRHLTNLNFFIKENKEIMLAINN